MNLNQQITAAQKRDPKAEKALFLHFAPKVFLICRRYTRSREEAEDFLQDCFLHLFQEIHRFDPEKGAFEGWLHRLSTNTILQHLRKQKRMISIDFPDELPEPNLEEADMEFISDEKLQEAISCLPDGYKTVLNLYIFEKWSHQQIARELEISESSSRSQLSRARKLLKQLLTEQIPQRHVQRLV
ncbi:MAG: sigma-70 family RNA polymerase sigma factor [Saprospiraceae bacterium]|nr:sigma-70 family RNA polymerase sigma factor [Saprospiraceae bacterium]